MRRQLNLLALAITSMLAIAFLIPLLGLVSDITRDRALDAAEQDAQLVSQLLSATSASLDPAAALSTFAPDGKLNGRPISVATSDGRVVGSPIPTTEDLSAAMAGAASNDPVAGGRAVLVPSVQQGGRTAVVRIFVANEELTSGVGSARAILVGLSLALVGISVFMTDRLARRMVRPVEDLSAASAELAAGDLTARVKPTGPTEIVEVGQQFNRLAGEVASLLQAERETAADLSHRLRTPLTAARLDAERIADVADREAMMRDLDAIERSVDHSIKALRGAGRVVAATSFLEVVAANRVAFWEALAEEQGREFRVHLPQSRTKVGVAEDDLVAAIDALIGNVFAHTPEGTPYELSVEINDDTASLRVNDQGPGFAPQNPQRRGISTGGSTGLGLDIARQTATLAGGRMEARNGDSGGATVTLTFARR